MSNGNDGSIIQSAYGDALTKLFQVYFNALTNAAGDASAESEALDHFRNGVAVARKARDQALAAVGQG